MRRVVTVVALIATLATARLVAAQSTQIWHDGALLGNANPLPTAPAPASTGVAEQASADGVSNFTFAAANKLLSSLTVKIGATTGYVMVFDAASLPSNGAVTPKWCYPVLSDGTRGFVAAQWTVPILFSTGITVGFSTTGCDTLTASTTAKFMGQAN